MEYRKLFAELEHASLAFPLFRPHFKCSKNANNEIVFGPEVIWYKSNMDGGLDASKSAFFRLEAIAGKLVENLKNAPPINGNRKLPGAAESGYNNSGRLLLWCVRNPSVRSSFRWAKKSGTISRYSGLTYYEVEPIDNVFLIVRNAIDSFDPIREKLNGQIVVSLYDMLVNRKVISFDDLYDCWPEVPTDFAITGRLKALKTKLLSDGLTVSFSKTKRNAQIKNWKST